MKLGSEESLQYICLKKIPKNWREKVERKATPQILIAGREPVGSTACSYSKDVAGVEASVESCIS